VESGALSDPGFSEFAKKVVLFCHVTTQVETDKYQSLLKEKGGRGFPTLLFLDADGNVLAQQGERTVAGFERTAALLQGLEATRKKADAGDASAKVDLLLAEMKLGGVKTRDQASSRLVGLQPDAGQKKELDSFFTEWEVEELMAERPPVDEVAQKFAAMWREGRVPEGRNARYFWNTLLTWADKKGDAEILETALAKMKELSYGQYERRLAELKKKQQ